MKDDNLKGILDRFVRKYGNYRPYEGWGVVKKVFNQGMGALALYRVYEDERIIAVNEVQWNKTDERKLKDLKRMLGGRWKIVWCSYGYPSFYNHNFSLQYAINRKTGKYDEKYSDHN